MPHSRHFGTFLRIIVVAFVILAWAQLQGCGGQGPEFVDAGHTYTSETVTLLLERSDAGDLARLPSADAMPLRQEALTDLRGAGGGAAEAASTITKAFPADATGVPYYVERATYDGTAGWVILEARGPAGGTMRNRLLWVIDSKGEVLYSVMR